MTYLLSAGSDVDFPERWPRYLHEIEWWGSRATGTRLIEASDIEYQWIPGAAA
jgi:hypothetical protein